MSSVHTLRNNVVSEARQFFVLMCHAYSIENRCHLSKLMLNGGALYQNTVVALKQHWAIWVKLKFLQIFERSTLFSLQRVSAYKQDTICTGNKKSNQQGFFNYFFM